MKLLKALLLLVLLAGLSSAQMFTPIQKGSLTVQVSRGYIAGLSPLTIIYIQTTDSNTQSFKVTVIYSLNGQVSTRSSERARDLTNGTGDKAWTGEWFWLPDGAKILSVDVGEVKPAQSFPVNEQ